MKITDTFTRRFRSSGRVFLLLACAAAVVVVPIERRLALIPAALVFGLAQTGGL